MKRLTILIVATLLSLSVFGQSADASAQPNSNLWKTLSKITYKKEYDEFLGFKIDKPVFAQSVQDLEDKDCLLYTSPSPRDKRQSRMPSSA